MTFQQERIDAIQTVESIVLCWFRCRIFCVVCFENAIKQSFAIQYPPLLYYGRQPARNNDNVFQVLASATRLQSFDENFLHDDSNNHDGDEFVFSGDDDNDAADAGEWGGSLSSTARNITSKAWSSAASSRPSSSISRPPSAAPRNTISSTASSSASIASRGHHCVLPSLRPASAFPTFTALAGSIGGGNSKPRAAAPRPATAAGNRSIGDDCERRESSIYICSR